MYAIAIVTYDREAPRDIAIHTDTYHESVMHTYTPAYLGTALAQHLEWGHAAKINHLWKYAA